MDLRKIINSFGDNETKEKYVIAFIAIGAVIFYLPFLSFQFIGDDWLWLANAKRALTDPSIFIERPMYGYFRPLNMIVVALWESIFGPDARVFSFISILLHAINVFLLWLALKKYDAPKSIRILSPFIFAFYYLNCAAIEWISVGHDLWVTGLMLIYLIRLKLFYEKPNLITFLILFLIGWAAALFKESGLIAIGFYFVFLALNHTNPFNNKYRLYSLVYLISYAAFIIFYFLTRTVADKQIIIGLQVIINLWYFLIYLLLPLSRRIVERLPNHILTGLVYIKNALTMIVPILLAYIFAKGTRIVKILVMWPIFFIFTIAVFKWGVTLFMIYPNDPASRFMYSPFAGMAVCIAWVVGYIKEKINIVKHGATIIITLCVLYIGGNYLIVNKVSQLFIRQQKLSQSIVDDIKKNLELFEKADSVIVLTRDISKTEEIITKREHLAGIIFVKSNKLLPVELVEMTDNVTCKEEINAGSLFLRWDIETERLLFPKSF